MEPSIPVGSIVYSQKTSDYQKGDIISFKNAKGQTITHRIVAVTKRNNIVSFRTKGDANNTADAELVQVGNVVGKTVITVPYVGKIVSFIKTPIGFGLIIILPTLLFILGEFWNIKKEIEKEVEKKIMAKLEKANT
jgi:signal peptidase